MSNFTVDTERQPQTLALTNNSTDTNALSADADVFTETGPVSVDSSTPTANSPVKDCTGNSLLLQFIGQDTSNDEVRLALYLWNYARTTAGGFHWYANTVITFDVLFGTKTGNASGVWVAADLVVDTITATGAYPASIVREIWSPAGELPAHLLIDTGGAARWQVKGDIDGGSGTAGTEWNVLYRSF